MRTLCPNHGYGEDDPKHYLDNKGRCLYCLAQKQVRQVVTFEEVQVYRELNKVCSISGSFKKQGSK